MTFLYCFIANIRMLNGKMLNVKIPNLKYLAKKTTHLLTFIFDKAKLRHSVICIMYIINMYMAFLSNEIF